MKSTRLLAASTTGQREDVERFAAVGHDLAMGLEIAGNCRMRPRHNLADRGDLCG